MKARFSTDVLLLALRESWSSETSADPACWTPDTPSAGQCAVTACVLQDFLGGDVVWAAAEYPNLSRHSHYFNRLDDGTILDLTIDQFPSGTVLSPEQGCARTSGGATVPFASTRAYILSFPATHRRYEMLREGVRRYLERLQRVERAT